MYNNGGSGNPMANLPSPDFSSSSGTSALPRTYRFAPPSGGGSNTMQAPPFKAPSSSAFKYATGNSSSTSGNRFQTSQSNPLYQPFAANRPMSSSSFGAPPTSSSPLSSSSSYYNTAAKIPSRYTPQQYDPYPPYEDQYGGDQDYAPYDNYSSYPPYPAASAAAPYQDNVETAPAPSLSWTSKMSKTNWMIGGVVLLIFLILIGFFVHRWYKNSSEPQKNNRYLSQEEEEDGHENERPQPSGSGTTKLNLIEDMQNQWLMERQQLQAQLEESRKQEMKLHQDVQKLTLLQKHTVEKIKHHARDLRTPKSAMYATGEASPRSPAMVTMPNNNWQPQQQSRGKQQQHHQQPELAFPDDSSHA